MNGNYLFFLSESHIHCNWMVLGVTREMQTDFSNEWTWPQTLNKQSLNLCNRSKFLKFALKPKKLNLILSYALQCYYRVTMFGVIIVVFIFQIRTTLPCGSDTHQQRRGELYWARRCLNIMQKNCFNFLISSPQGSSWKKIWIIAMFLDQASIYGFNLNDRTLILLERQSKGRSGSSCRELGKQHYKCNTTALPGYTACFHFSCHLNNSNFDFHILNKKITYSLNNVNSTTWELISVRWSQF